ncbi:MAG: flagellar hook-associated protein FlgK [Gammaproteobacteria bacterium]|nr:flagellar hook-associated protein FlgK [Gammaproteobacteria bacterium]
MTGVLNIGVSALMAFQRSLSTTGHNIANSETEGYSRQRTELSTRTPGATGVGWVGTGVQVDRISRMYDDFMATQVRTTQSAASQLDTYYTNASRIDGILGDPVAGLDPAVQDFFDGMNVLADDPASLPSRQVVLADAQSLVDRFNGLSQQLDDMRRLMNNQMGSVTDEINAIAGAIASLNEDIVIAYGTSGGGEPNDLLDQREVLLNHLAEKVDISVVPQDNGAWNVFMGKGQVLVLDSHASTIGTAGDPSDASRLDIVYSSGTGSQVITGQMSGGEIGGLLAFRDEVLDPAQNRLGLIAVGISDRVNSQHQLGLDLNGQFGGDMFSTPAIEVGANNTTAPAVTASFVDTGNLTDSDYRLVAGAAADDFTLTRVSDGQSWSFNTGGGYPYTYPPAGELDGFSISISAAAASGDEYLIRPTRQAARLLSLEITDPRQLAAAAPIRSEPTTNANTGGINLGNASITQPEISDTTNIPLVGAITLEFDSAIPGFDVTGGPGGSIAYNPATQSGGASFTFAGYGGMTFSIQGIPQDGDSFVIGNNTSGVGDNRNALVLAELQNENTMLGESGGVSETTTFQGVYGQLISDVGTKTYSAEINLQSVNGLLETHQMALSSVNGVNLDEEAANLVKFQQAYQAAAQVIAVSNTVFDTLLSAVRR